MYPLAHAAFALGVARLVRSRAALPSRGWAWLALGALLPDLLDKALGLVVFQLGEGRLWGHTLVFALAWLLLGRASRGSWLAWPALVGWGCLSHLALDVPQAATALWPLLGHEFPIRGYDLDDLALDLWRRPVQLAGEVAGGVVLAVLVWERARARRGSSGTANPPP